MNNIYSVDRNPNIKHPRKYSHDELIQEFRLCKTDKNGKPNKLPKKYNDKNKWIQITDSDLFLRTHPQYLQHIADELDDWWVFMTITNPKLNSDDELKKKSDELKKKFEKELKDYIFDNNLTKNQLENMTYYQIKNITDSFKK